MVHENIPKGVVKGLRGHVLAQGDSYMDRERVSGGELDPALPLFDPQGLAYSKNGRKAPLGQGPKVLKKGHPRAGAAV
jgi:hypothetical protein